VKLAELKRGVCINTKWGNVRPSLHLQCAAISMKYLGEAFDIHTGSRELLFPHHENEMAMARASTGKPLARYWVHSEGVIYDGSLGVSEISELTLDGLKKMGWDPRTIRYWLIQGHYRKPLLLSRDTLNDARRATEKLDRCIKGLSSVTEGAPFEGLEQFVYDLRQIIQVFREMDSVLKIFKFDWETELSPEVRALMKEREAARHNKEWTLADSIRDELVSMGVDIQDGKV